LGNRSPTSPDPLSTLGCRSPTSPFLLSNDPEPSLYVGESFPNEPGSSLHVGVPLPNESVPSLQRSRALPLRWGVVPQRIRASCRRLCRFQSRLWRVDSSPTLPPNWRKRIPLK
jgi:hypothetical protein